jgi:hypothetical protein
MTIIFFIGLWLFIIGVINLDIIHKSSPIGEEMALEFKHSTPMPKSWQDYLLRVIMCVGLLFILVPSICWIMF